MDATNPSPIITVAGERIALGPMRRDLLPRYLRWVNDWETTWTYYSRVTPWTPERRERWYDRFSGNESDTVGFTVYERESLRPIGYTMLTEINHAHGTAEFSIMIGEPDMRGKGLGTEATRLTLDYAFTARGLTNVMLMALAFNHAGLRAYEKAGFRVFGRRSRCRRVAGRWYDVVYMECLADDFTSPVLHTTFDPDTPPQT